VRTGVVVLTAVWLTACPEPAPPGYDPSNPQPLGEAARKPPPEGSLPPNVPPPPPSLGKKDDQPVTAPPGEKTAPPPSEDPAPTAADFAKHFSVRFGSASSELITIEGDAKSAVVHEVRSSKNGEATLKSGRLGAEPIAALVSALSSTEWWKLPAGRDGPLRMTINAGATTRTFTTSCPGAAKNAACPPAAAEKAVRTALAGSKAEPAPPTKLLKFKPGGVNKATLLSKAHCAERERPGYFTCVRDNGPVDHCIGKGHKFVCYQSPFETKGLNVTSDVPGDEKKKPPTPEQPWGIELPSDRCVATQGHWRCEHDTEVSRVTQGKTWLAWPGDGDPVAVKAGYAE